MALRSSVWFGGSDNKPSRNSAMQRYLQLNLPSHKPKIVTASATPAFLVATAPAASRKPSDIINDAGNALPLSLPWKAKVIAFTLFAERYRSDTPYWRDWKQKGTSIGVVSSAWFGGSDNKPSRNSAIQRYLRLNLPSHKPKIVTVSATPAFLLATAPAASRKPSDIINDAGNALPISLPSKAEVIAFTLFAERYRCAAPVSGATGASAAGVTDIGVGTIAWFAGVRNNEGCEMKGGNTLIKPAAPKSLRKPKSVIRTIEPTRTKNVEPTLIGKTKDGNLLFKSWKDFVSSLRRATF